MSEPGTGRRRIGVGSDHVGLHLKEELRAHLEARGHELCDFGFVIREKKVDFERVVREVCGYILVVLMRLLKAGTTGRASRLGSATSRLKVIIGVRILRQRDY